MFAYFHLCFAHRQLRGETRPFRAGEILRALEHFLEREDLMAGERRPATLAFHILDGFITIN